MGFDFIIGDFNVPAPMIMDHQLSGADRRIEDRGDQPSRPKARNLIDDNPNDNLDGLVTFAFFCATRGNLFLFSDGRQIATVR